MTDCKDCIKETCLFQFLKEDEKELISKNKEVESYKRGDTIIKQGDETSNVMSLSSGSAKIYIEGIDKKKLILYYLKPSEFFGSQGIYTENIHYYSVEAMEDCKVCIIDKKIFKQLINTNAQFSEEFIKFICKKDIINFQRYISLTQKQMPGRIADSFLYLYNCNVKWEKHENADTENNIIKISKRDIADLSNIARDNVTRLLKQFQNDGIINVANDQVELLDIEKLQEISRFG